ncbi:hypothetical protein Tco_0127033 [Tanacetum coccineum]
MTISTSNGFCSKTLIYHSTRPPSPIPPKSTNISVTDFIFSLTTITSASLIDATTRCSIPYSDVPRLVHNLTVSLRQPPLSLTKGDTAYIISPNSSYIPILYLSLFAIGVTVSPANPVSSILEVSRQIHLCKPTVTFATLVSIHKLLEVGFSNPIVLIGSPEFESMMRVNKSNGNLTKIAVLQSDTAAILYSSDQPPETQQLKKKASMESKYKKHSYVALLCLETVPALQRQFENYPPQNMLAELRKMFEKPPALEIYDLVDTLHSCKQAPGKSVSEHVLEMKGLMDQLHTLGKPYDNGYGRYPKKLMGYYFYFPPENKVIVARYGDFLERDLISQEFSGRDCDLEDDHIDTLPSENTSGSRDLGEPLLSELLMIDPVKGFMASAMDEEMKSMKVNKVLDCSRRALLMPRNDLSNEMCASSDEEKAYMKKVPYASAVGSIMYAVRCTRPDVAFAQNLVSRYQQNPGKLHWVVVKHILKYLRNTKDMFLVYGGIPDTELDVTGFCDASGCDKDDTKSQKRRLCLCHQWRSSRLEEQEADYPCDACDTN